MFANLLLSHANAIFHNNAQHFSSFFRIRKSNLFHGLVKQTNHKDIAFMKSISDNIFFTAGCDILQEWITENYPYNNIVIIDFNRKNVKKTIQVLSKKIECNSEKFIVFCDEVRLLPIVNSIKIRSDNPFDIFVKKKHVRYVKELLECGIAILNNYSIQGTYLSSSEFELFYSVMNEETILQYTSRKKIQIKTYYSTRDNILKKLRLKRNELYQIK